MWRKPPLFKALRNAGRTKMKRIVEAFGKLVESPESLLIVLGAVLLALGASGGVTYNNWFPITQLWAQAFLGTAGFILVLVGSFLVRLKPKSPRPYGISITYPEKNDHVHITDVKGTIRKRPTDYSLWLFRVYTDQKYTPVRQINPVEGEQTWQVKGIDVGGTPGENRELRVYLVGRSGQAFLHYYQEASKSHNAVMDNFKVPKDSKDRWVPPIGEPFKDLDMIECDRVPVVRASPP
jgi:hypothetical protein